MILAGRGWGKTRTGGEWIRQGVESGTTGRIALVGPTAGDVRDVMIEGPAGILAISPPSNRPRYEPSKRRLTWPNGAVATTFSAEEPDRLRGPQHDRAWCDEVAAWKYAEETWDNLQFGMRLGQNPQAVITTTPRPIKLIRDLLKDPGTVVTRGTTYENKGNLAASFLRKILDKYEGTRLGRQELNAEILEDTPGALWTRAMLEQALVRTHPELARVAVAVDPSVSDKAGADEAGIIAGGIAFEGIEQKPHGYVLRDASSRYSPDEWARVAVKLYHELDADVLVAEANNGGDMVRSTIHTVDRSVNVKLVHASRGKRIRAEPIAALYEQRKVSHVGTLSKLEDEMCTWAGQAGEPSPNRVDALVWCLTELMVEHPPVPYQSIRVRSARA